MARSFETVGELLNWSYANLAMAHSAVREEQAEYKPVNYQIRARLFKGLMDGSMSIGSIFDDEKVKLSTGQRCSYCGATDDLAVDHLFARKLGGKDTGDNLIHACRSCNSSKGKKDLLVWMAQRGEFPPLMILRRYLKLVIAYCVEGGFMDSAVADMGEEHPFSIGFIPVKYPIPSELILSA